MEKTQEAIETLKEIVQKYDNIVFFGGAGVSTESGIPDFRSVDGLYHQQYDYPPETILSHTFYRRNPEEFYRFYRNKMLFPDARKRPGSCGPSLPRILTGFIRQPAAAPFWSCTVPCCVITVKNAGSFTIWTISAATPAFLRVRNAAAL